MDGLIEARNAIMHGLGRLTRKQTRTLARTKRTQSKLAHAQIRLANLKLVLDAPTIDRAGTTCVNFIEWVDHATVERGLLPMT
jgi:hypothetical protein